jgi:hypothetical protein
MIVVLDELLVYTFEMSAERRKSEKIMGESSHERMWVLGIPACSVECCDLPLVMLYLGMV